MRRTPDGIYIWEEDDVPSSSREDAVRKMQDITARFRGDRRLTKLLKQRKHLSGPPATKHYASPPATKALSSASIGPMADRPRRSAR
jgi:hypothetical protein